MKQCLVPAPGKTEAVRGWPCWPGPWGAPAPGWDEGLPRDLSAPFLGPDWRPTGQGQTCHPGEPGPAEGLGRSASPGQLNSEAAASLPPRGAPGSWSLQPHSSLRPTSLVLPTAQMGGEGAESSFMSREETAPLLSEARAKSGRLCVCVCVYTTPSLPPSLPSSEMLFNSLLPREPPSSILPLPQPSPAQVAWTSLWLPLRTQDPSSALGALDGEERQSGSKWVCLSLSWETEPSAPLLLEQAPASPICCETLNSGPIASHLEPEPLQAPEMSRPEPGSKLWREG